MKLTQSLHIIKELEFCAFLPSVLSVWSFFPFSHMTCHGTVTLSIHVSGRINEHVPLQRLSQEGIGVRQFCSNLS